MSVKHFFPDPLVPCRLSPRCAALRAAPRLTLPPVMRWPTPRQQSKSKDMSDDERFEYRQKPSIEKLEKFHDKDSRT